MIDTGIMLLDLFIILVAAKISGEIAERLGQPQVIGELLAGALLGPSILGLLKSNETLSLLAQLGIIILMLEIGMENGVREFKGLGLPSFLVAVIGIVAPFALGYLLFVFSFGLVAGNGQAAFLGATLAATSVGITARTFSDMNKVKTPAARIVLGAAVLDDVIGLVILSAVLGFAKSGSFPIALAAKSALLAVLFLLIVVFVGRRVVPPLLNLLGTRAKVRGGLFAGALSLGFLSAFTADKIGLSPIIGAFAAGTALTESEYRKELAEKVASYSEILVGIFFVWVGMMFDIRSLADPKVLFLFTGITVAAIAGKVLSGLGAKGVKDKLAVGIGMIPRGEVGLIFAGVGLANGIIAQPVYSAILLMVFVTTVITPPLLKITLKAHQRTS